MATHSSILAWEILWAEESGGLHSMRSQKSRTRLSNNNNSQQHDLEEKKVHNNPMFNHRVFINQNDEILVTVGNHWQERTFPACCYGAQGDGVLRSKSQKGLAPTLAPSGYVSPLESQRHVLLSWPTSSDCLEQGYKTCTEHHGTPFMLQSPQWSWPWLCQGCC